MNSHKLINKWPLLDANKLPLGCKAEKRVSLGVDGFTSALFSCKLSCISANVSICMLRSASCCCLTIVSRGNQFSVGERVTVWLWAAAALCHVCTYCWEKASSVWWLKIHQGWLADNILGCLFIIYYSCGTIQAFQRGPHNSWDGIQKAGMSCGEGSDRDWWRNRI